MLFREGVKVYTDSSETPVDPSVPNPTTQFMGPDDASLTWGNQPPDYDTSIGEDIPF